MNIEVYLAVVEEPALWDTTGKVVVRYLGADEIPHQQLVDPTIVGIGGTTGVWDLLLWHETSRRAFYGESSAD